MQSIRKRRAKLRRAKRGFSLIELVVTVAIIAMISAAMTVAIMKISDNSKRRITESNAETLRSAVKVWWATNDATTCPDVATLIEDGALDRSKSTKADGWGEPWQIQCEHYDATVVSKGPDKKLGTDDDIRVPPG